MFLFKTLEGKELSKEEFVEIMMKARHDFADWGGCFEADNKFSLRGWAKEAVWEVTITDTYLLSAEEKNKGTKVRGKYTKVLSRIGVRDEEIKRLVTKISTKEKGVEIWITKEFYKHYKEMYDRDIVSSCMAYPPSYYERTIVNGEYMHPLEAYEQSEGFHLALLKPIEGEKEEYPYMARAVCYKDEEGDWYWAENGYGVEWCESKFAEAFPNGSWGSDAYIPAIETDEGDYVAPYDDCNSGWSNPQDGCLYSDGTNQINADWGTLGLTTCSHCGAMDYEEDMYETPEGYICTSCRRNDFIRCDRSGDLYPRDEMVECNCGESIHERYSVDCEYSGDLVCRDCIITVEDRTYNSWDISKYKEEEFREEHGYPGDDDED